ncbi:hypothetical protein BO70DRAFT_365288 [Aspergillus heteromorphus CBS 117.55]|uniref:Uncharacterized protein n=1 Tax=Aspergillus heteromorphus CBS 117.55 TaxID=1448321 RepID=A0A317VCK6_9EURO|nr:uncharacterized protein BO70DRAFT_365288 [Aspergillus heteromorphus CBS 117.55]PWY70981.1 hypothetical protein BO70DRAFT_365288 [Aspergillus heteromorphus CBS 117.55]
MGWQCGSWQQKTDPTASKSRQPGPPSPKAPGTGCLICSGLLVRWRADASRPAYKAQCLSPVATPSSSSQSHRAYCTTHYRHDAPELRGVQLGLLAKTP